MVEKRDERPLMAERVPTSSSTGSSSSLGGCIMNELEGRKLRSTPLGRPVAVADANFETLGIGPTLLVLPGLAFHDPLPTPLEHYNAVLPGPRLRVTAKEVIVELDIPAVAHAFSDLVHHAALLRDVAAAPFHTEHIDLVSTVHLALLPIALRHHGLCR